MLSILRNESVASNHWHDVLYVIIYVSAYIPERMEMFTTQPKAHRLPQSSPSFVTDSSLVVCVIQLFANHLGSKISLPQISGLKCV